MRKRILTTLSGIPVAAAALLHAVAAKAQGSGISTLDNLNVVGTEAYGSGAVSADKTLPVIVATIIKQAMGLLGVLMVVLVIYAGFLWMTAGGSEEKVSKAKKLLTNAVIGVILIFLAYAITSYVIEAVLLSSGAAPSA